LKKFKHRGPKYLRSVVLYETAEFVLKKYDGGHHIQLENSKFYGSTVYCYNLELDHSAQY